MFNIGDIVNVTKVSCCYGHKRNTVCQVVNIYTERGKPLYLCYPQNLEDRNTKVLALWHCESCLSLVEAVVKDEEVSSDNQG